MAVSPVESPTKRMHTYGGSSSSEGPAGGSRSGLAADTNAEAGISAPQEEAEAEGETGTRKPTVMPSPEQPTEAEIREHEVTHLPPRSWCPHCVRGRAVNAPHHARSGEARETHRLPTLSVDFFFMAATGALVVNPFRDQ